MYINKYTYVRATGRAVFEHLHIIIHIRQAVVVLVLANDLYIIYTYIHTHCTTSKMVAGQRALRFVTRKTFNVSSFP